MMDADERLRSAKARLNRAAQACLENRPGAADEADAAHRELENLRARTKQCDFPGCSTLTVQRYCARHRPQAGWAIGEQVRDEIEAEGKRRR